MSDIARYNFFYEGMEFEIVREEFPDVGRSCIAIKGVNSKILLFSMPHDLTVDQAILALNGFFQGVDFAEHKLCSAISKAREDSIQRRYHLSAKDRP